MDETAISPGAVSTDFLVARPSFLSGVARLLDLWGGFDGYNVSRDGRSADEMALNADWRVIGQDLEIAIEKFRKSHPKA